MPGSDCRRREGPATTGGDREGPETTENEWDDPGETAGKGDGRVGVSGLSSLY